MSAQDAKLQEDMGREEQAKRWGPAFLPLTDALAAVRAAQAHLEPVARAEDTGTSLYVAKLMNVADDSLGEACEALEFALASLTRR